MIYNVKIISQDEPLKNKQDDPFVLNQNNTLPQKNNLKIIKD